MTLYNFPESLQDIPDDIRKAFVEKWQEPFGTGRTNDNFAEGSFKYVCSDCKSFQKAIEPKYKIIIGRRGSGKTALVKFIKIFSNYDFKIICQKDELVRWIKNKIRNVSDDIPVETYKRECENFFWNLIFQEISKDDEYEAINIFLRRGKKIIEKIWFGIINWAEKNQASKSWVQGIIANIFVQFTVEDNEKFEKAKDEAKQTLKNKRVIILIDNIEEYEFESENLKKIFSAILLATVAFDNQGPFTVKCFFPSEYYSNLKKYAVNWGKISGSITFLRWTKEELLVMLCKRLAFFLYCNNQLNIQTLDIFNDYSYSYNFWKKYFPETVTNKVFNVDESSIIYVLRHTQMSPRQAIRICNKISSDAQDFFKSPNSTEKTIGKSIEEEEKNLSIEVFTAFKDIYPNAEYFCDEYLKELTMGFKIDELKKLHNQIASSVKSNEQTQYDRYRDFRTFLRMLCELGIVGKRDVDNLNHPKYCVAIFEPNEDYEMSVGADEYVYVHPMFIRKVRFPFRRNKCRKPICSNLLINNN
ncbi:hypothetical protein [Crocosphaera sp.]|uniref:P-loop ATPase, Sll1717 family n=1 Tax=Crocosphaera sp. TaxID=2729996 RepID=UPI002627D737|nr:hypothetical protein [Crocosphaera sp.]MDJ0580883.1 hypothetical protein [Crocosphaera sp.]